MTPSNTEPVAVAADGHTELDVSVIPESRRQATLRDIALMWAGGFTNISNVIYGALLISLGLSLGQAVAVIVLANLSYVLLGLASLPGPAAGTTSFAISRAPFGPNGNRVIGSFNWLMMLGFKTFGLSTIALAVFALISGSDTDGVASPVKVLTVIAAAVVMAILPVVGFGAINRALQILLPVSVVLFVILAVLALPQADLSSAQGADFITLTIAFAIAISGSGLSYSVNGSDYSRNLPAATSRVRLVAAVAASGFIPSVLLMTLGAVVATGVPTAGDPISGLPAAFPAWFLIPYLIVVCLQQFGGGAIVTYSSAMTLQAIGVRLSRVWCIALDMAICVGVTLLVVFSSSFYTFVSNFLQFMIVWFAPWCAIFIVDYFLRAGRYDSAALLSTTSGLYWRGNGWHLPGLAAQLCGMVCVVLTMSTSIWVGPVSGLLGGADTSVIAGLLVGGGTYYLLARRSVRSESANSA